MNVRRFYSSGVLTVVHVTGIYGTTNVRSNLESRPLPLFYQTTSYLFLRLEVVRGNSYVTNITPAGRRHFVAADHFVVGLGCSYVTNCFID